MGTRHFLFVSVCYHCGGWPEEVNSCFLNSYMVFYNLNRVYVINNIHSEYYYYAYLQLVSFKRFSHSLSTRTQVTIYMAHSPCFLPPLADFPLLPFLTPFYLFGTLLAVTGSVHLGLRLLVNWPPLSHPFPKPSPLQIPRTPIYPAPH